MASSQRSPSPSHSYKRTSKLDPTLIPYDFVAVPRGSQVLGLIYGPATLCLFIHVVEEATDNLRAGREMSCEMDDDAKLAVKMGISRPALAACKRNLQEAKIVPSWDDGPITFDGKAVKETVDRYTPRTKPGRPKKCSPRTEPEPAPEPVMVQIPGTAALVPIDDACEHAGGAGARCACPLHRLHDKDYVNSAGASTENTASYPVEKKVDFQPDTSPPPPGGGAISDSHASEVPEPPLTGVELRTSLSQVCMDVFKRIAATGPLWDQTAANLESRDNIAALEAMIREAPEQPKFKSGRKRLEIGLIGEWAKDVAAEARAARPILEAERNAALKRQEAANLHAAEQRRVLETEQAAYDQARQTWDAMPENVRAEATAEKLAEVRNQERFKRLPDEARKLEAVELILREMARQQSKGESAP